MSGVTSAIATPILARGSSTLARKDGKYTSFLKYIHKKKSSGVKLE
jgi:hypothetical protein